MKLFSVKNIADFCNVDFGFIRRIIEVNEIRPKEVRGNANEKKGYTFYQLYVIQLFLEQLAQKDILFDFENEEVYTVYESKINCV